MSAFPVFASVLHLCCVSSTGIPTASSRDGHSAVGEGTNQSCTQITPNGVSLFDSSPQASRGNNFEDANLSRCVLKNE